MRNGRQAYFKFHDPSWFSSGVYWKRLTARLNPRIFRWQFFFRSTLCYVLSYVVSDGIDYSIANANRVESESINE